MDARSNATQADERWYFSKKRLECSPSRKCDIDADKELSYRQQAANFIQDVGQRLQVSQLCINTAIVYMHRFYVFHSFTHFSRFQIASAALFLAAKVEEQPRKLEHVIKVAHMCLHKDNENPPPVPDVKSEQYAQLAHELVFNENILLQTLGFDVAIDHPHTHVVRFCYMVKASKDLSQTSYFLASNSLHLTTMCLQYKPTVVACFCIHLACKWSNWEIPPSTEGRAWYHYIDKIVTIELLDKLTDEFIQIYNKCPSRLKKKIMSMSASQGMQCDANGGSNGALGNNPPIGGNVNFPMTSCNSPMTTEPRKTQTPPVNPKDAHHSKTHYNLPLNKSGERSGSSQSYRNAHAEQERKERLPQTIAPPATSHGTPAAAAAGSSTTGHYRDGQNAADMLKHHNPAQMYNKHGSSHPNNNPNNMYAKNQPAQIHRSNTMTSSSAGNSSDKMKPHHPYPNQQYNKTSQSRSSVEAQMKAPTLNSEQLQHQRLTDHVHGAKLEQQHNYHREQQQQQQHSQQKHREHPPSNTNAREWQQRDMTAHYQRGQAAAGSAHQQTHSQTHQHPPTHTTHPQMHQTHNASNTGQPMPLLSLKVVPPFGKDQSDSANHRTHSEHGKWPTNATKPANDPNALDNRIKYDHQQIRHGGQTQNQNSFNKHEKPRGFGPYNPNDKSHSKPASNDVANNKLVKNDAKPERVDKVETKLSENVEKLVNKNEQRHTNQSGAKHKPNEKPMTIKTPSPVHSSYRPKSIFSPDKDPKLATPKKDEKKYSDIPILSPFGSPPVTPTIDRRVRTSSGSNSESECKLVPLVKKLEPADVEMLMREQKLKIAPNVPELFRASPKKPDVAITPERNVAKVVNGDVASTSANTTNPIAISSILKQALPVDVKLDVDKDPERRHKSDKKKKKEKHKHKDREKEKKKKHKEHKSERHETTIHEPRLVTPIKLKLPTKNDNAPDDDDVKPSLKIKISKDLIDSSTITPQPPLKLKIPKDKLNMADSQFLNSSRKRERDSGADDSPPMKTNKSSGVRVATNDTRQNGGSNSAKHAYHKQQQVRYVENNTHAYNNNSLGFVNNNFPTMNPFYFNNQLNYGLPNMAVMSNVAPLWHPMMPPPPNFFIPPPPMYDYFTNANAFTNNGSGVYFNEPTNAHGPPPLPQGPRPEQADKPPLPPAPPE